jgi:CDGSH-type Zn-finger protein
LTSGASGYPAGIERDRDVTITPYRDGPLLVRGDFTLVDQDGNEIPNERATIALCRCGKSRMRPFCDGSHKLVDFRAPSKRESGRD